MNFFGIRCALRMCQGEIDHDKHSVFYRCLQCGKKDRAPAIGDHWEPLPAGEEKMSGIDWYSIAWAASWAVFGSVAVICFTYYKIHN